MKIDEIIQSLKDQARDRESLIPKDEPDSIFAHDAEALRGAVELLETMQRFQKAHGEVDALVAELRRKGLTNGGSLGHHAGIMDDAADAIAALEYTILGIMHSVDKWLDGPELEQDEVNRAATMREKTLRLVEGLEEEVNRFHSLAQAEQAGRLVVQPCKKGDTLYSFYTYPTTGICEVAVTAVEVLNGVTVINTNRYGAIREEDIGKTVFLTRQEAEEALELRKKKHLLPSKDTENVVEGTFHSIWDGGVDIATNCKINLSTKEVFEIEKVDPADVDSLDREYVVLPDGSEHPCYAKDEEVNGEFWYA